MRKQIKFLLLFCLAVSFNLAQVYDDPRICQPNEKKPGFCIFISKPVCNVYYKSDGTIVKTTYINRCFACKSPYVQFVYDKPCYSYPSNARFCIPHPTVQAVCSTAYEPACGYYNKKVTCLLPPCATTFKNSCYACLNNNVDYHVPGFCPKFILYTGGIGK